MVAKKVSSIVKKLSVSGKYGSKEFNDLLCMKTDELDLMLTSNLLKARKINEHTYSRAWVPVEAPSGAEYDNFEIERPPNPDR